MIQETSKASYLELISSDKLGEMQKIVLDGIVALKEATDKELSDFLDMSINCVTGRRNELVEKGIVESVGRKVCQITGNNALSWRFIQGKEPWQLNKPKFTGLSAVKFKNLLLDLEKTNDFQKKRILAIITPSLTEDFSDTIKKLVKEVNNEK